MEGATSSSMVLGGGRNWPFQRSPGDLGGEVVTTSALAGFRETTVKQQAEVDSADEFSNFQWNVMREQMNNLSREVTDMRKGYESLRTSETRHEVREADFSRMAHDQQLELEKVILGHRKDGQEVLNTMTQLRQAFEIERSDRTASLQALQRDVAQQMKHLNTQHQQLEVDRERRGLHIEELQTNLEMESKIRQAEIEGKFSELNALSQNFQDHTQSYARHTIRVDELEARLAKDHSELQTALSELHVLQKQFKDELGEAVGELAKSTDIERDRRSSLEADTAKQAEVHAELQDRLHDHHKNVAERLSDLEAQFLKDHTDLSSTVDELHLMQKQLQQELGHVLGETEAKHADFQKHIGEAVKTSDLHEQNQTLSDRVQHLHDRVERVNDFEEVLKGLSESVKEDLELHRQEQGVKNEAHLERHSELSDRLAKLCISGKPGHITELIDGAESLPLTDVINEGPCAIISKVEFDVALKQLWDAIDSHTHEVDVGALQRANAMPVQMYQVGPATLPTAVRPVTVPPLTLQITPPTTPQSPQARAMAGLGGSFGMRTAVQQPPTIFGNIRGRSVSPAPPVQTMRPISPGPPALTVTSPLGSSLSMPPMLTMGMPAAPMNFTTQGGIRTIVTQQPGPPRKVNEDVTWETGTIQTRDNLTRPCSVVAAPGQGFALTGAPVGITTGPASGSVPSPYSPPSDLGASQASLETVLPSSGSRTPPSGVRQLRIAVRAAPVTQ